MAKAKVNIPWPTADGNYIAYNWEAGSSMSYAGEFWERRRQNLIESLNPTLQSYTDNIPDLIRLGERVRQVGLAERKKELDFLRHNLPDIDFSHIEDKELFNKINKIINGERQFKFALDRIKSAIQLGQTTNQKGEKYKGLAPTMAAVFMSYLTTTFTEEMRNIAKEFSPAKAVEQWKKDFDNIFSRAIDRAVEKAFEESEIRRIQDTPYGDARQWRELGEAYKQLLNFQQEFKDMLKVQLKFDELKQFFDKKENQDILKKTRRNKRGTGGFAEKLGWKSQQLSNNIGGNVNEYIGTLIAESIPNHVVLEEGGSNIKNTVIKGKVLKADTLSMAQFEAEVGTNLERLFQDMEFYLSQSTSLKNAAERFETFYQQNLAHLSQNNFYTLSNYKMASLGSGFSGFHNGGKQPLENLVDYIDAAGMSTDNAKDFINVAYNTLNDAIFSDMRDEVEENIRNILTSAAAKLLFDDWSTIGTPNTGTQILNFFNLNGVILPSSILFINLGEAMIKTAQDLQNKNRMKTWFSVYVHLPETVVYHKGDWRNFGNDNITIKEKIWEHWKLQAEKAKEESYFESKFLFNFKTLISSLGDLGIYKI